MTCKDCIYHDICAKCDNLILYVNENIELAYVDGVFNECDDFKDKSRYVELPCPIGSKLYMLVTKRARVYTQQFTFIKVTHLTYYNLERVLNDFGKTVFLTREQAEKALAERSGK